jgi:hypothetical protein
MFCKTEITVSANKLLTKVAFMMGGGLILWKIFGISSIKKLTVSVILLAIIKFLL